MQHNPYLRHGAIKRWVRIHLFVVLTIQATIIPTAWPMVKNPEVAKGSESEDQLLRRIDFGNSYIRGQTIQSGAVYLLQRKKSDIESLLKPRQNYREEILKDFHVEEKDPEPTKVIDLNIK